MFRTNETKKGTQTVNSCVCEKCNLNFNSRTTMWRHKKTMYLSIKGYNCIFMYLFVVYTLSQEYIFVNYACTYNNPGHRYM